MASSSTASAPTPVTEGEFLLRFWDAHGSTFMKWFLGLPYAGQLSMLRNASPDLPLSPPTSELKASDFLAPELTLSALLADEGKPLVRLLCNRARFDCAAEDLAYLKALRAKNRMPTFSGTTFDTVALAFIDPKDPEQQIQSLLPSVSAHVLDEMKAKIQRNVLIEADVWLTLQMRQQIILTFLANIARTFEQVFFERQGPAEAKMGCRTCGASTQPTEKALLKCPCDAALYCSKEHQTADWPHHKAACKLIRQRRAELDSADVPTRS
ncbi:hypothetical protein H257_06308 [Aphanomyces astaci]|uniref:MYND-type domain-containing protein n=1 Tax=Aphanomyces astaci TaxID=112090 RepID=W4GNB4_APHAT|nr:hypothetical protein H257_06308 [Aphanomyces astaci]ETV80851.1 hypothetical protein H257_06308 [Aphanomyces astaci]RQM21011.1 hypothetical protein B5M09_000170 [Aphanomyces astaci]|eukprot:XP_009829798.1 hypothetical protein H257_06308 [Aphanomyces astaci]